MKCKVILFCGVMLLANYLVIAQQHPINNICNSIEQNVPTPWGPLHEGDVNFSKRVVRIIDLREKQNQVLMHPKNALPIILYNAIKSKKLIGGPFHSLLYRLKITITSFSNLIDLSL